MKKINAIDVVNKYIAQYPELTEFFKNFYENYPTYDDFNEDLYNYADDYEDGDEDEGWSPEGEVYMLEENVGKFPGAEIWVDFKNELMNNKW